MIRAEISPSYIMSGVRFRQYRLIVSSDKAVMSAGNAQYINSRFILRLSTVAP